MNKKQLKHLKKIARQNQQKEQEGYIDQLKRYAQLFDGIPQIKLLINNVLESDRLIQQGLLPQPLPKLLLPDNIQDVIYQQVQAKYPPHDKKGDQLWDQYTKALPQLDKLLRNYRDYLEDRYGMWSYVNATYIKALSEYLDGAPVLEIMAGNGYISAGLQNLNPGQKVYPTDSKDWTKENQTGRHDVTKVEKLDALSAIQKYGHDVQYVIMSWSPDKLTIDMDVLNLIRQDYPDLHLLVIGEKNGATDSPQFWKEAHLSQKGLEKVNQQLKSFDLIDEQIYLAS
ncbi:SAM-dependent methyltransferase [Limosilactobacillus sp.]|uniref:SAM-dependent methyltransferase n=1 Tax=Limosilactobacillus sp. TaxID=2773925 RepID=UPI00345E7D7D